MSPVIGWIESRVKGLSFCDIGGLGGESRNERVSVAIGAGAASATMIDARREDYWEWEVFRGKMREKRLSRYETIAAADLESSNFRDKAGRYDFVHSTGILYHLPAPIRAMENLYRVTNKYLVVDTIVVPNKVENSAGKIRYRGSEAIFVPSLTDWERRILKQHYQDKFGWTAERFDNLAPPDTSDAPTPWRQFEPGVNGALWGNPGDLSYSRYWWLFTADAFRALVRVFDLKIIDEHSFKEHTLCFLCEKA